MRTSSTSKNTEGDSLNKGINADVYFLFFVEGSKKIQDSLIRIPSGIRSILF
jgi:hypothetical protein